MKAGVQPISTHAVHVVQLKQLFRDMQKIDGCQTTPLYELFDSLEARISRKYELIQDEFTIVNGIKHITIRKHNSPEIAAKVEAFYSSKKIFEEIRGALLSANDSDLTRLVNKLIFQYPHFISPAQVEEAALICEIASLKNPLEQNALFQCLMHNHQYGLETLEACLGKAFTEELIARNIQIKEKNVQLFFDMFEDTDEAHSSDEEDSLENEILSHFRRMAIEDLNFPQLTPLFIRPQRNNPVFLPRLLDGRKNSALPGELPNKLRK